MTTRATETPGLLLRHPDGQTFRFDPGALCLELLATGGPGAYARFEVLTGPRELAAWVAASRLPPGLRLAADGAGAASARGLRDALWDVVAARAHGTAPAPVSLATVNAAAAAPPLVPLIAADGTRAWAPGEAPVTALLSTVARDAVDLLTGPHADRVRECAADDCALLFVDTSRPGRRRWCSMERCGNRHKVRAHRARRPDDPAV